MLTSYINLDKTIKLVLIETRNNTEKFILDIEEIAINDNILDVLYSKLKYFNIDNFIIITKGVLTTKNIDNTYNICDVEINNNIFHSLIAKNDIDKLLDLAKVLKIQNIKIVDRYGFYTLFNTTILYIDEVSTGYNLLCFDNQKMSLKFVTKDMLRDTLINYRKTRNINKIEYSETVYCEDFVNGLLNYKAIKEVGYDKNTLKYINNLLSFCIYSTSPLAPKYTLDFNKQQLSNKKITNQTQLIKEQKNENNISSNQNGNNLDKIEPLDKKITKNQNKSFSLFKKLKKKLKHQ